MRIYTRTRIQTHAHIYPPTHTNAHYYTDIRTTYVLLELTNFGRKHLNRIQHVQQQIVIIIVR